MSEFKWQEVKDEQIAEVGWGGDPAILAIRFKPLGTEYHYEQIPPRMHRALLAAESKHHYFAENIRSHPDLYPYTRYDTPVVSNGKVEAPGTALAKVDNLKPEEVFVPGYMDKLLTEIRTQALEEAKGLDISTEAKRKALKSLAFKVVKSRTYIEGLHKAYTQAEKKRLATVDAEKRRICEILQGIEEEVRAPLTAWEQKEEARIQRHKDAIAKIQEMQPHVYPDIPSLKAALVFLGAVDPETFEEWSVPAEQATEEAIQSLTAELEKREQAEAQRMELEALRAEAAKRAEQDRLAAVAREAREQAEREARETELRLEAEKAEAERRAKAAEAQAEADRIAAEQRAQEAAAQADRDREAAVVAERQRAAAEAERLQDEVDARARDNEHREHIHAVIREYLLTIPAFTEEQVGVFIELASRKSIPHVSIQY